MKQVYIRAGIALTLVLVVVVGLFTSCGPKENTENDMSGTSEQGESINSTQSTAGGGNAGTGSTTLPVVETQENLVRVSLPEGFTMLRMAWTLGEAGVATSRSLIDAAKNGDYSEFPFITTSKNTANVCFPLEGYLFPSTYEFYKDQDPVEVWKIILRTTQKKLQGEITERAAANGLSVHELLTLASIIEKEALNQEQRNMIAGVLYNRLKAGMKLQCDPTINYVESVIWEEYDRVETDFYKYHYNTYRTAGLPAGPICNSGMNAINAAMYPSSTDYLYFVIVGSDIRFAKDLETHEQNIKDLGYVPAE